MMLPFGPGAPQSVPSPRRENLRSPFGVEQASSDMRLRVRPDALVGFEWPGGTLFRYIHTR